MSISPEGYSRCLKDRNFVLFWLSELLAYFSISTFTITLLAAIENTLPGHLAQGLVLASSFLPAAFVIPLGGRLIDRFGPQRMLLACKLASMSLTLLLLVIWQDASHVTIYGLILVNSVATVIAIVASGSLLPRIVAENELLGANTLVNLAPSAMIIAGGVTIALYGNESPTEGFFLLVAAGFLASWLLLLFVSPQQVTRTAPADVVQSTSNRVWDAVRYLRGHRALLIVFLMRLTLYIGTGAQVLLSILAESVFFAGAAGVGLLFAARGAGIFVGPLLARRYLQLAGHRQYRVIGYGLGLVGLGYLAAGLLGGLGIGLVAAILAVGYCGAGTVRVTTMALLQQLSEDGYLPRLLALEQGVTAVVQSAAAVVIAAAVVKGVPQSALTVSMLTGLVVLASAALWLLLIGKSTKD